MTGWVGQNWQTFESEDAQTTVGVTLGVGLLDEPVEATGSLAVALAALRAELARAVELGPGVVSVPEVSVDLGTDMATLVVRGRPETVAAAWDRLPHLFTADVVPETIAPSRSEHPLWPADLARRTGRNAAALAWLKTAAGDAVERARARMARLDPASGRTRAVFFTTEDSLVGLAYPVRREVLPLPAARWADGTPRCGGHDLSDLGAGNGRATVPSVEPEVLLSALVPRSSAGVAAARLLLRQLGAADRAGGGNTALRARLLGLGADFCLVVVAEPEAQHDLRRRLLPAFARDFPLMPDPWLEDAVAEAHGPVAPALLRERRVAGLGADPGVEVAGLRQALARAAASLHLASAPPSVPSFSRPRPDQQVLGQDGEAVAEFPAAEQERRLGAVHTFRAWTPLRFAAADMTTRLVVADTAVLTGSRGAQAGRGQWSWQAVDLTGMLAVLEDQADSVTLLDTSMRSMSFHPELFRRPGRLRRRLCARLAGVPHLPVETSVDREEVRRWARRGKLALAGAFAAPAAVLVYLVTTIALNGAEDKPVTARITIGDTARLGNDSTITARGFDILPPSLDDPEYTVTVQVEFCAGDDTKADGLPPETGRTVDPGDFDLLGESYTSARLTDSDEQLRKATLREGRCTAGDLVFRGQELDNPHLSYENAADDDVVWYRYGQVPK